MQYRSVIVTLWRNTANIQLCNLALLFWLLNACLSLNQTQMSIRKKHKYLQKYVIYVEKITWTHFRKLAFSKPPQRCYCVNKKPETHVFHSDLRFTQKRKGHMEYLEKCVVLCMICSKPVESYMILVLFPLSHTLFTAHLKLKNRGGLCSGVLCFITCWSWLVLTV